MAQGGAQKREVKKVVLAYSGGLDTSIILKWLQTTYRCEVVTFTADLGKGNDQVRFELSYYALKPDVTVIAPWREWELRSREALIAFAEQHQIPIAKDKRGEAPFSVDANLLHASSEGKVLEDPAQEVPDYVYSRTLDPQAAPDKPTVITVGFERGDATSIDGKTLTPAQLLAALNELGRANGIGRLDLVEN